ncbi:hypothetical protein Pcinc_005045 [Petrolisthes cinctipes]|uniref:Uncharacterized protein n=1 Tax=Petrolisthes cinctipes TaxID=88211 RepID=A0AAE1L352_PETCI|nr:hypothetical protein Pcinc_005045 [Petrolisthes cinctipes]
MNNELQEGASMQWVWDEWPPGTMAANQTQLPVVIVEAEVRGKAMAVAVDSEMKETGKVEEIRGKVEETQGKVEDTRGKGGKDTKKGGLDTKKGGLHTKRGGRDTRKGGI